MSCVLNTIQLYIFTTELPDIVPDRGDVVGDEGTGRIRIAPSVIPVLPEDEDGLRELRDGGEKLGKHRSDSSEVSPITQPPKKLMFAAHTF